MHELVRTNNAVLISVIGALLDEAGIGYIVLDQNMSVLEGSIGVLPRRLMVAETHAAAARTLLEDVGLGRELIEHHPSACGSSWPRILERQ